MAMALREEELQAIGEYVQIHLKEWLPEQSYKTSNSIVGMELAERFIRVEEELKNQRELMKQGFDQIDKRFEQVQINMDKRFDQVDKRFEQVDKRFEQVQINIDKRFEQVDKRFEQVQINMDKRFDQVDKRFSMMFSFITIGFVVIATMMSVFQFLQ